MRDDFVIALDAMGGDAGPVMVLAGAALSATRHPACRYLLIGDEAQLRPLLENYPVLASRSEIRHSTVTITMEDKPSHALRRGRTLSSMGMAVEAVRSGQANLAVSAGNTGALMAMARFGLKMIPGFERPAIAVIWPTTRGESIVLDVGATIGADAEQLIEFAVLGAEMARCLFGIKSPTLGLLNVGVEDMKGVEEVRKAHKLLRASDLTFDYKGFVEGDDISRGTVDVVVTEGFTGNIALKASEGTARQITDLLRTVLQRTLLTRIGAWLASGAFRALREQMDPRKHNGGVFLGLNGIVVKSHGGTDAPGFACAIDIAIGMARNDLITRLSSDVAEKNNLLEMSRTAGLVEDSLEEA